MKLMYNFYTWEQAYKFIGLSQVETLTLIFLASEIVQLLEIAWNPAQTKFSNKFCLVRIFSGLDRIFLGQDFRGRRC